MIGECLVLLFTAVGCSSCSVAKTYLEKAQIPHQVVDVVKERERARLYGVWGTPAMVITKRGVAIARLYGFDRESFERWYGQYCL